MTKRKPGPPRSAHAIRRDGVSLHLRLTQEETRALRELAQRREQSVVGLIREALALRAHQLGCYWP